MKQIVVATDFSKLSSGAVQYAAQLAKFSKSSLVLLHVYSVPVVMSEASVGMPSLEEVEKDCIKRLKRSVTLLKTKFGARFPVSYECRCGFALEEISGYLKEHKPFLLVAGLQGSGYINDHLIGSITTQLIKKAACPVLTIGKNETYSHPKKIVLAYDLKDIENKSIFDPLKELITAFKSKVLILNVFKTGHAIPSISEAAAGIEVDRLLGEVKHSFHYVQNNDVVEALNEFVEKQKANMVVMLPRKHSLLSSIMSGSQTKRMAYHSKVPLLSLHD